MIRTDEDKRASLSYMLAWVDALCWAIANYELLTLLMTELRETDAGGPMMRSVVMQASDMYDELGADPHGWESDVPRDSILEISIEP